MATKTADYIWFNGKMVPWAEANVHVLTHAMHYGTSVFEGVRCYNTPKGPIVFRHQEHAQRLKDSAKIYRFPIPFSVEEIMEATRETLHQNKLDNAYIRPLAFVGNVGLGVCPPT
ncbi:aminotransferase class IV, partial [Vibrio fluvialis]